MKMTFFKCALFVLVVGSLALTSGCKTRNGGGADWEDDPLISGMPIDGEYPMGDPSNLPEGDRSLFPPVYFAYDSSQVNAEEVGKCEEVARYLSSGKGEGVIVEGHGDERGSREYNLALGERRALSVRDYLISLGVDPASIHTKSYGEEMPDDMGHDEAAWRKNRRAVFAIY